MSEDTPLTPDVTALPRHPRRADGRINLVGLTRPQLRAALTDAGTPEKQSKMRATQLWQWIYQKGSDDFAAMTNLAKPYRALLTEHFVIERPELVSRQAAADALECVADAERLELALGEIHPTLRTGWRRRDLQRDAARAR